MKSDFKKANYRKADNKNKCCEVCDLEGNHKGLFMRNCSLFDQWELQGNKEGWNSSSWEFDKKHNGMVCDFFEPKVERINGYKVEGPYRYWKIQDLDMEGKSAVGVIEIVKAKKDAKKEDVRDKWCDVRNYKTWVSIQQTTLEELKNEIKEAEENLKNIKNINTKFFEI